MKSSPATMEYAQRAIRNAARAGQGAPLLQAPRGATWTFDSSPHFSIDLRDGRGQAAAGFDHGFPGAGVGAVR